MLVLLCRHPDSLAVLVEVSVLPARSQEPMQRRGGVVSLLLPAGLPVARLWPVSGVLALVYRFLLVAAESVVESVARE